MPRCWRPVLVVIVIVIVIVVVVVVVVVVVRVRVRDQRHILVSIATMRTSRCLARRASSGGR